MVRDRWGGAGTVEPDQGTITSLRLEGETISKSSAVDPVADSIIVENSYGYTGPEATKFGRTTAPGIARIDLDDEGGCHTVRTSQERVPSKGFGPGTTDAWYFTAIDFRTGATVFKQPAGTGLLYNNDYSGLYLGPDGTAYVGVLGGLGALRDSE